MIRKIDINDFYLIFHNIGQIITVLGLTMIIPLVVALVYVEYSVALDFLIGICCCVIFGFITKRKSKDLPAPTMFHGMLIAGVSWLFACVFSAIPYYLSGHYFSFLDAIFDLMSGFTTTGLVLIQDMEHLSNGLNMWRHLVTYLGGQGIVVLALTFLIKSTGGAYKTMVGEGKDEVLEPSIRKTSQNIWIISVVSMVLGTTILFVIGRIEGLSFGRSFLDGMWMFMSAWSTGGFAPHSQNVLFYHSYMYEYANALIMIIGSFNFALHYAVWKGSKKELFKNIELKSFIFTSSSLVFLMTVGFALTKTYSTIHELFRRGVFNIISAHTTTGQMTIYPTQMGNWPQLAFSAACIAMMIGGSAASTAGGFKNIRVGLVLKGISHEIKKLLAPEKAIVTTKYHHIKEHILEQNLVFQAALIILAYIVIYGLGTIMGMICGYPLGTSAFESISAGSNTGLTAGITGASMPAILKASYIIFMWAGRLEFMAIYVFIGTIWLMFGKPKKRRKLM